VLARLDERSLHHRDRIGGLRFRKQDLNALVGRGLCFRGSSGRHSTPYFWHRIASGQNNKDDNNFWTYNWEDEKKKSS
jgi:hypothetical protein